MKNIIRKWTLVMAAVVLLGTVSQAQNIDTNRMNRDIKIMENILGELFKVNSSTGTNSGESRAFTIASGFGTTDVKGTYLPGYGIIFTIPQVINRHISSINVNKSGGGNQISFYYNSGEEDGDESDPVTEESVVSRISEFLSDYASTIGQLKDDENVMVIYGPKTARTSIFAVYTLRGKELEKDEVKELPVISVVAKKSDLEALRSGNINKETFEDRLDISKSKDKEYLDLKVMSNIFETALKEVPKESYRLIGNTDYLMLENFGALFSMNVRFNLSGRAESYFFRSGQSRLTVAGAPKQSARTASAGNNDTETEEELAQKLTDAYQKLVQDIKEYIIDYGRTLSSVKSGQYILTSVNLSDTWIENDLPDRIDFQIQKSVLERMDRGTISRDEAINSVTVTEY